MSLILGGHRLDPPGLEIRSWLDDARIPQATDTNPRREWIRAIVVHTTGGRRGRVIEGAPPSDADIAYARYQANTPAHKSWDFTVDRDGSIAQSNDPMQRVTWHAGSTPVNNRSVGIEMVQGGSEGNNVLYSATIEATARLVDFLTFALGIQRQTPTLNGRPYGGLLQRLGGDDGGRDVVGIYGHRNVPGADRGPGDPGDFIFNALLARGYEGFDLERGEDLMTWKARQAALSVPAEGVPGPLTVAALKSARGSLKRWTGLWVMLPCESFAWQGAVAGAIAGVAVLGVGYWAGRHYGLLGP